MNDATPAPVVCFLQGPSGFFFWRLARELQRRGARTLRINLCAGDRLNWPGPSTQFRGCLEDWGPFVERFLHDANVTHLFLLGEQRAYHRIAIEAAHKLAITVVVTELGYLRPDWLTLELDGMSGNSRFPKDPRVIRALARGQSSPSAPPRYRNNFIAEAVADVSFHLANMAFRFLYRRYRTHLLGSPLLIDIGIGLHMLKSRLGNRWQLAKLRDVSLSGRPYFVFPLQIENDFQIRAYSPYRSIGDAISEVMASFARHAPADSILVIKEHPREIVWLNWRRNCLDLADQLGIRPRIMHLDGGPLDVLLAGAQGIVTINSTTGLQALQFGRPLKILGQAIFNIEGLACSGPLDEFWANPVEPDPDLRDDFVRLLAATTQVRGGYYSSAGSRAAIQAFAERILSGRLGTH
jgi:capsular polysaccharide export protein